MRRRPSIDRRVLGLVGESRLAVPDYGSRVVNDSDIERLLGVFNIRVTSTELSVPAIIFPPVAGFYRLVLMNGLPRTVRRYIKLHETAHVLAGEAEEPIYMLFTGPLPDCEDVADCFALLGIVDEIHDRQGDGWLEQKIRELVPLDDRGWQVHRIPRLAKRLPRVREMVRERLDGFSGENYL